MDQLEAVWSGALERSGGAPGLSAYAGRSSLYHSANWEAAERFEALEMSQAPRGNKELGRGKDRRPRKSYEPHGFYDARALELLRKGCSYGNIVRELGCSMGIVRRVAKSNGIDRSGFQGTGARRVAA